MTRNSNAQVVIVRKAKKVHAGRHIIAFALTGGASSVVTGAQAARVSAYNRRTRRLAGR